MLFKIIILSLFSLLLAGCGNNDVARNNNSNNYSRLNNNANYPLNNYSNNISGDNVTEDSETTISGDSNVSGDNYIDEIKDDIYGSKEDLEITPERKALHEFTTPILTSDPNRYHNIKLVRDRLNGYILENNETFSFNEVCGPYGADDGFKEASILLSNGQKDKGYGGGVCQLSSTLYNAIKDLDVDITERHNHSRPVGYVPENEDATVSLQSGLDFKFKNVSGKSLEFKTSSTEDSLTVTVYEKN